MKLTALWLVGALSSGVLALALGSRPDQLKPPRQEYSAGPYLYRTFCASCHGETGKGDGPVSDLLRQRPPDLTTITARQGGVFPRAEVTAIVDGRRRVAGHGSREMPVWGDMLRVTEGPDEAIIRKRIDALVAHLESIQSTPGSLR